MNRKKILFTFITFLFFILLSLISIELFLRGYSKFNPTLFAPKDKKYDQFRANPKAWINGFQLNSKGYHDEEFTVQKKDGVFRILAIGDSFTFGVVPYKDNFITLLQESLKEKNPSLEILNMGIPGTSVKEYLSLFVDEGLELNPDMLLLNVYIGNDILETEKKEDSNLYTVRFFKYVNAVLKLKQSGSKPFVRLGGDNKENSYDDNLKSMDDQAFYEVQKEMFIVYFDHKHILKYLNYKYNAMFKEFENIKRICDSKNIKLLVVLIPAEIQVDKNLQKIIEPQLNNSSYKSVDTYDNLIRSINYTLPNTIIRKELSLQGIQYVDLLEPFQEKALALRLYKPQDTHWGIVGNQFAAQILNEFFLKKNIIPSVPTNK